MVGVGLRLVGDLEEHVVEMPDRVEHVLDVALLQVEHFLHPILAREAEILTAGAVTVGIAAGVNAVATNAIKGTFLYSAARVVGVKGIGDSTCEL